MIAGDSGFRGRLGKEFEFWKPERMGEIKLLGKIVSAETWVVSGNYYLLSSLG